MGLVETGIGHLREIENGHADVRGQSVYRRVLTVPVSNSLGSLLAVSCEQTAHVAFQQTQALGRGSCRQPLLMHAPAAVHRQPVSGHPCPDGGMLAQRRRDCQCSMIDTCGTMRPLKYILASCHVREVRLYPAMMQCASTHDASRSFCHWQDGGFSVHGFIPLSPPVRLVGCHTDVDASRACGLLISLALFSPVDGREEGNRSRGG